MSLFGGLEEENEQISNLTPEQLKLEKARRGAAVGSFGKAADYWNSILRGGPEAFKEFEAPAQRQFKEEIIPDLAEQFAGMGSGNLSSSGFRNASIQAGVGLSERLAAMRAGLRENAAANLYNLGNASLTPHAQWGTTQQAQPGFLQTAAPIAGTVIGGIYGGPPGAAAGNLAGQYVAGGGPSATSGISGPSSNPSASTPFGTAPGIFGKTNPYGSGTQGIQGTQNAVLNAQYGR